MTFQLIPFLLVFFTLQTDLSPKDSLVVGNFSSQNPEHLQLPEGWIPMNFTGIKRTHYRLELVDATSVVRAESNRSASGLAKEQSIDLREFPILRWTWRVDSTPENSNIFEKSGDDFPARLYLLFDYGMEHLSWGVRQRIRILRTFYGRIPTRAINYVWDANAPVGTITPNAYSDLVTMVVVESGTDQLGRWVTYERNVYQDYRDIFNEEPPLLEAIAIMTDSDDTKESALAFFGDISFHRAKEK